MVELARLGGSRLVMAANMPMSAGPELMAQLWDTTFAEEPFAPMDPNDGLFRLMEGSRAPDARRTGISLTNAWPRKCG